MIKTALITGSSEGIGFEFAKIFAEQGNNLVLVSRNKSRLDEIKKEFAEKYKIMVYDIAIDLSGPGSAMEIYNELKNRDISVQYLINNAGMGDFSLFAQSDWNRQERMINLNIGALTHLTRLFLPEMIARGEGRIINVASTASFQPGPTMAVYFASKAYVLSFSEALNEEVRNTGITVTALCPGSTESRFHSKAIEGRSLKERRLTPAREVAEYGYRSMLKGKSVAIPGFKNRVMAAVVRFLPRDFVVRVARKIQENKFRDQNN
jgi:uncharacterized protein